MEKPVTAVETALISTPLWRAQIIRVLQILGTLAALLGVADFTPYLSVLNPNHAALLVAAGTFCRLEAPQVIDFFGDWLDNGKRDGSFTRIVPMIAVLLVCTLLLQSCAGLASGISGAPVPTVPVQRVDNPQQQFDAALADVMKAEQDARVADVSKVPRKAWGFYDAGMVADRTREVIQSGK